MSFPRLSFPEYLQGDTHSTLKAAAPDREVISLRATIRRDLDQLGEGRGEWLQRFAASCQHSGSPDDVLEAAAYYCALQGDRLPGETFCGS